MQVSICCSMEIYNEAAIFRQVRTRHTRIYIIFILKTTSIGSHVREKSNWDRGWFIHLRLIHTLTWLNFDYHWLCVWFGSCENRRLTQSRSSGVLHGWPGVKNASAAPTAKRRTSHEPNWLNWVRLMWGTAFDPGLRCWTGRVSILDTRQPEVFLKYYTRTRLNIEKEIHFDR